MENEYLDTHFDAGFSHLRWLPWIGSAFRDSPSRTMVLGESIYDYSEGRTAKREQIEGRNSLRERQLVHGIHETYRSKYLRHCCSFAIPALTLAGINGGSCCGSFWV